MKKPQCLIWWAHPISTRHGRQTFTVPNFSANASSAASHAEEGGEFSSGDVDENLDRGQEDVILAFLVTMAAIVVVVLVANIYTIASCIQALVFSHRKHLQRAVAKLDLVKSEGYLQVWRISRLYNAEKLSV